MSTNFLRVPAMLLPSEALLTLPGSKSHANRALICAALSDGTTTIRGATPSDDVEVMVENLRKMGFGVEWKDKAKGEVQVRGGLSQKKESAASSQSALADVTSSARVILDCHNAGTTLRFLTSLACLIPGQWVLTGDPNMRKRPIGDLVSALRSLGAEISDTNGCPPIQVQGGNLSAGRQALRGGSVTLKADISSQYLSSLLMIASKLQGGLTIGLEGSLASEAYIGLTLRTMEDFGAKVEKQKGKFIVAEAAALRGRETYDIEGDWSAAGAWFVLNALTGSSIGFTNLRKDSEQADRKLSEFIERLKKPGDVTFDASPIPDQVMNLAVLAAFRKGKTTMTGIANLRKKECDRLHVITTELKMAGVDISERPDGLVITGNLITNNQKLITLDPHNDHRMAMCFAILGLVRGGIAIQNPDCVVKSYPNFFEDLHSVLKASRPLAIVGMRGAGKSSLARRVASRLKLKAKDSDHAFTKQHGPIRPFVEKHGWTLFRKKEEEVIASLLSPGIVLACGGGATETAGVRSLLKERSVPVWLKANEHALVSRLKSEKRPRLTELPLHEEVKKLALERSPNYKSVAAVELPAHLQWNQQVPFIVRELRSNLLSLPHPGKHPRLGNM